MTATNIFTWIMMVLSACTAVFALLLVAPGVIELIAEVVSELSYSVDKLKKALRGEDDGN